jgi:hypothetical protein
LIEIPDALSYVEGDPMKGSSSKSVPPGDTSPNAPWKDGSERSERWKETLDKGFLPRVSGGIFFANRTLSAAEKERIEGYIAKCRKDG